MKLSIGYYCVSLLLLHFTAAQQSSHAYDYKSLFEAPDGWKAPENISKKVSYYISGHDFEGRAVVIAEGGRWNFREMVEAGAEDMQNMARQMGQLMQLLKRLGMENGRTVEQNNLALFDDQQQQSIGSVIIVDLADFDFAQLTSPSTVLFLIQAMRYMLYLNVAEYLAYAHIINMNAAAQAFISIARPVLGTALDKFEMHGTNKERWIPILLRQIPKDQLPEWYGGSKNFQPLTVYG